VGGDIAPLVLSLSGWQSLNTTTWLKSAFDESSLLFGLKLSLNLIELDGDKTPVILKEE
jgi:hypothetical protein